MAILKISVYFISLLLVTLSSLLQLKAQDTLLIPLKIKVGAEVSGPVIYFIDKNVFNAEGYISADLNEKVAATFNLGYLDFKYSQYNYDYFSKGFYIRSGADFNVLKPGKSMGKYFVGVGVKYGLSRFSSGSPSLKHDNYWGSATSSIPESIHWGHFIEATPGVRAELFRNLSIGWSISIRKLIHSGTGKDLRPVYLPGYGDATKSFTTGMNYFIVWNIPFKKITVITKKETPPEPEDTETTGAGQQGSPIRQ